MAYTGIANTVNSAAALISAWYDTAKDSTSSVVNGSLSGPIEFDGPAVAVEQAMRLLRSSQESKNLYYAVLGDVKAEWNRKADAHYFATQMLKADGFDVTHYHFRDFINALHSGTFFVSGYVMGDSKVRVK